MTRPRTHLLRILAFLLAVLVLAAALGPTLVTAYAANPVLNTVILGVLLVGVAWNIRLVVALRREAAWLDAYREARPGAVRGLGEPGRLLAPMAAMLANARRPGTDRFTLSSGAMRGVLDGIGSRLDEARELSRYATGLLVFLGLLGTFWGLILTIGSVAGVVEAMSVGPGGGGDLDALFEQLRTGLGAPLRGMGVAFSSSLLGLAGALVLGFVDLQAGQAGNRFYNELEEWLAGATRLSSGVLGDGGDGPSGGAGGGGVPAYVQALLEQTAENLEALQRAMERGEEGRAGTTAALSALAERMAVMTEQMRASQVVMARVAEGQAALGPVLARLAEAARPDEGGRAQLRAIEGLLARLLEETSQGRQQATAELRSELKLLARTVAALGDAPAISGGGGGGA